MIWENGVLCAPGTPVKGDRMIDTLRVWPPRRSKLAALYYIGKGPDLTGKECILYLGAAAGTTVSFLADYTEVIYAVEMAPGPLQDLLKICKVKRNIIPIPADAGQPDLYAPLIEESDIIYQDIAQRDQAEIAVRNLFLLKSGGLLILMLKVRSIAMNTDGQKICTEISSILERAGMSEISITWLTPYYPDHAAMVFKKR
ncbi:MAG TPA: fibrillarin-like rRNA/tRNA 2'-O-methyltransferase [Methanospirillum sp.]|nr:fibrillarin-like rRNA/tRNA 2'-O-methyltransferase [Methanospirillum sp.]